MADDMTKVHVQVAKPSPELQRDVEALLVVLVNSAKHANVPLTVESLEGLDWARAAEIAIVSTPSPAVIKAVTERVRTGNVMQRIVAHHVRQQREHRRGPITLDEALGMKITFGKNKGAKLSSLTINQLEWYATECYFEDLRTAAGLVLAMREEERSNEEADDDFKYDYYYDKDW
jgi:hypothetical protein